MHRQKKTPRAGGHIGAKANRHSHCIPNPRGHNALALIFETIANLPPDALPAGVQGGTAKATLFAMAWLCDWRTGVIGRSIQSIADAAGINRKRTVADCIKALEGAGIVHRTVKPNGRGQVARWKIDLDRMYRLTTEHAAKGDGSDTQSPPKEPNKKGDTSDTPSDAKRVTEVALKGDGSVKKWRAERLPDHDSESHRGTEPAKSADSDPLGHIEPDPELQAAGRANGRRVHR